MGLFNFVEAHKESLFHQLMPITKPLLSWMEAGPLALDFNSKIISLY